MRYSVLFLCLLLGACTNDGGGGADVDPSGTVSFAVGDPQPAPEPVLQAAAGLTDRTWKLVELGGKRAAFPDATLRFEGKRARGHSGCNHVDGTVRRSGDSLRFRDLSMTEIGCTPALHAFETDYAEALGAVRRWEIRGRQLVLRGDGKTLVFDPP